MLATRKQIAYLQALTDRAEALRRRHPGAFPAGLYHKKWEAGMTSEKASLRIQMYESILAGAARAMAPNNKTEDLPK